MTPLEAARAFFEACAKEDWNEVQKFESVVDDRMKEYLGGLKIVSLGKTVSIEGLRGLVRSL